MIRENANCVLLDEIEKLGKTRRDLFRGQCGVWKTCEGLVLPDQLAHLLCADGCANAIGGSTCGHEAIGLPPAAM